MSAFGGKADMRGRIPMSAFDRAKSPSRSRRGDRMSNCVVRSRGSRLPGDVVAQHGVEGCDHLAHDGDDDDFGLFVSGGETMVKDFESRIVSAGAQSCHVEHVTDWQPTTVDAAMSFEPAAVEVIRGETDEGGDLLAAHLA